MLRQLERGVQNVAIAKSEVLPLTALFFRKFNLNIRTPYK